jgi:hypothetical protein
MEPSPESYEGLIREVTDRALADPERLRQWIRESDWRCPIGLLEMCAFLAQRTGEARYLEAGRELLPGGDRSLGSLCVYPTTRAYLALRDLESTSPACPSPAPAAIHPPPLVIDAEHLTDMIKAAEL